MRWPHATFFLVRTGTEADERHFTIFHFRNPHIFVFIVPLNRCFQRAIYRGRIRTPPQNAAVRAANCHVNHRVCVFGVKRFARRRRCIWWECCFAIVLSQPVGECRRRIHQKFLIVALQTQGHGFSYRFAFFYNPYTRLLADSKKKRVSQPWVFGDLQQVSWRTWGFTSFGCPAY